MEAAESLDIAEGTVKSRLYRARNKLKPLLEGGYRMNIDNKDNIDIEKDDLNIKTHLNASLDKEGIYVSENLRKELKSLF